MTEIPLLMWFSKPYQKRYPGKIQSLLAHQREPFPNDLLYDTLIGVFDVKSEHYDPQADLSSSQYGPRQFLTLHGKKNYSDPSNQQYHQTINCQWLVQTQQTQRIFPHRINSIGKLNQILHDGFRSLELDLVFTKESNDRGHFAVGHDSQTMAGLTFDEYLNVISPISLDKIWLDVKNLQAENLDSMRNRLNFLEGKYHLKHQMILESSTQNDSFQILAADGYHTSYYLPTRSIIRLLEANEHSALVDEAERIAQQIATQHTQGVSFDHRLYPFVKTYLEPKLPMSLSYHLWDQQLKLWEPNLSIRLKDKAYYDDQRVKTILLPYWSHFNL